MLVDCKFCKNSFEKDQARIKNTKHNFCCRSCFASWSNTVTKRRQVEGACTICSQPISTRHKYCYNCKPTLSKMTKKELILERGIADFHRAVRDHSRNSYLSAKPVRLMECFVCKYNIHVEICHIKPVMSFDEDATVGEMNNLSNLIALCPNHHWEFDNGYLELTRPQ